MNMNELAGLSKEDKVFRLTIELLDVQQRKKESNGAYNDEIKDLKSEIKAQVEDAEIIEK